MTGGSGRLGSAQVRWNDYVGTAAADDADAILKRRSLYEIAGLDRDVWSVVGIDFSLGDPPREVVVYARRRGSSDDESDPAAELEVTAFTLGESIEIDQFITEAFNRVSVRLLSSSVGTRPLTVLEPAAGAAEPASV